MGDGVGVVTEGDGIVTGEDFGFSVGVGRESPDAEKTPDA